MERKQSNAFYKPAKCVKGYMEKVIWKRLYGKEYLAVAECLNNLGILFIDMGEQEKPEQCLLLSYKIFRSLYEQE